jgi:flagellar protein FliO/FliZ
MMSVSTVVLGVALVAAVVVMGALLVRRFYHGANLTTLFAGKPARRIDIVEQVVVDAKRRLLLVRRDDVEHLVMTGGPADLVIETGIAVGERVGSSRSMATTPTRPPRSLGAAAE